MKSVPISEFKAKCLRLVDEVRQSGETIQLTKRGKVVAVVSPPPKSEIDWTPGAFRDQIQILGDIQGDLSDLGIEWEVMR
jgi:prevent-host-death family protein